MCWVACWYPVYMATPSWNLHICIRLLVMFFVVFLFSLSAFPFCCPHVFRFQSFLILSFLLWTEYFPSYKSQNTVRTKSYSQNKQYYAEKFSFHFQQISLRYFRHWRRENFSVTISVILSPFWTRL